MTGPAGESRQTRGSRGSAVVDTVTVSMTYDEADAFSVYLVKMLGVWRAHEEQHHSALLNGLQLRAVENKAKQIRDQLPDEYPDYKSLLSES